MDDREGQTEKIENVSRRLNYLSYLIVKTKDYEIGHSLDISVKEKDTGKTYTLNGNVEEEFVKIKWTFPIEQ